MVTPLQASVPDYVTLTQRTERLAQAATSVKSCERFGFAVDADGISAEAQQIIDDAVVSGVSGRAAQSALVSALEAETDYQAERLEAAEATGEIQAFANYWLRRCENLAADPAYSKYFIAPE